MGTKPETVTLVGRLEDIQEQVATGIDDIHPHRPIAALESASMDLSILIDELKGAPDEGSTQ